MNQDVNVQQDTSASSKRVFKFHNVNREKILGNRKSKREESRKKCVIPSLSVEEEYRRKKAQLILEQFVPIKQKSPETGPGRGLRLVNIASLQEPSEISLHPCKGQEGLPDIPLEIQESPLDLPLDLSKKADAGDESPLDLSMSTKSEESEAGTDVKKDFHNNNQPLQFLLLKNISSNTFLNLVPSSEQRFTNLLPNIHVKDVKREVLQEDESSESKKSRKLAEPVDPMVQMALSEGRVVHVLPRRPVKEERISEERARPSRASSSSHEELTTDQNQNEMKQGRKTKLSGPEMMVKTNETVTKNGDLFCTFKNVKHMKMLREQQSRRTQKKSRRS